MENNPGLILYRKITKNNFSHASLDDFARYQEVRFCWQWIDGALKQMPNSFVEDWNFPTRRERARRIYDHVDRDRVAYGAFQADRVIGYILLGTQLFGSSHQYIQVLSLQVSFESRHRGIGSTLFHLAIREAKALGAKKMYISAHPSIESIAFYRSMGCVLAEEVNSEIAKEDPSDIQMEYVLL